MTGLVDDSAERSAGSIWLRRLGIAAAILAVIALAVWLGKQLTHRQQPARQTAKISILPDTPPPPPPPPEKPKIEPRKEIQQNQDKQKVETPPEPQQLKMEGQAGEGPSPFAAGAVANDYIGGDIGNGARFSAYVSRMAQVIQEELTRRNVRVAGTRMHVWLAADGTVQRYEISGAGADVERQLRAAMTSLTRLPEPPPQDMPMPIGLEISER